MVFLVSSLDTSIKMYVGVRVVFLSSSTFSPIFVSHFSDVWFTLWFISVQRLK